MDYKHAMPKTPKSKFNKENTENKYPSGIGEDVGANEDINKRSYYYDDAYGYKSYKPESEDSEKDNNKSVGKKS